MAKEEVVTAERTVESMAVRAARAAWAVARAAPVVKEVAVREDEEVKVDWAAVTVAARGVDWAAVQVVQVVRESVMAAVAKVVAMAVATVAGGSVVAHWVAVTEVGVMVGGAREAVQAAAMVGVESAVATVGARVEAMAVGELAEEDQVRVAVAVRRAVAEAHSSVGTAEDWVVGTGVDHNRSALA